jgi:hypothetical protein
VKGFGVFVLVFAVCAACAAAVGVFLYRTFREPVSAEFERIGKDVVEYASAHEQSECVPEAFGRLTACDGAMWCTIQVPIFAKECLKRAKRSDDLCEDVPKSLIDVALWPTKECLDIDADPDLCRRILTELAKTCAAR